MTVRRLRREEISTFVDELWFPFAEEMADLDAYNDLADDLREDVLTYRRRRFEEDDVVTFVDDRAGEITGYTVVEYAETPPVFARGPEGSITEVYVAPEYRGRGIVHDLMDRAETWASEQGCEHATLSVNADNDVARDVYESRGFSTRRHKMDKGLR